MSSASTVARRFPVGVFFACLGIIVAVVFVGLMIVGNPAWSQAEAQIVYAVNSAHTAFMDAVALSINLLFGRGAIWVGLLLMLVVFLLTRSWWSALRTGLLLGIPWLVAILIKHIVQRVRPDPSGLTHLIVPDPRSFSYPSGHTAFATALVCAVVLSIAVRRARRLSTTLGVVLILLVAYSRVYLGVHYPTDVVAAMIVTPAAAIALALLLASIPVFRRAPYIAQAPRLR
jgi:membrane-associated phospholipid phosphatase